MARARKLAIPKEVEKITTEEQINTEEIKPIELPPVEVEPPLQYLWLEKDKAMALVNTGKYAIADIKITKDLRPGYHKLITLEKVK